MLRNMTAGIGFLMDIEKPTTETGSTTILVVPLCAVEWPEMASVTWR
jgi:hypothetical protein